MKAVALKTSRCERYILGVSYDVLELACFAIRIATPAEKRKTRVVARKDFNITREPRDSDHLILNL